MPPRLPERYRLNIRLGSDDDIEEWLAQDTQLDRPVLVRYLAPEASHDRHITFLEGVRSAAALTELHLQKVFAAGETSASAYSISEWDGGVSFADRIRAGEGLPVEEFLPNAAGLCVALARFHATGAVHGAIDTSAVHFSAAHPAKIGAFGRQPRWNDQASDTRALAEVLRAGLTGTDDPAVLPSTVLTGVNPGIDDALRAGIAGTFDASTLAAHLSSVSFDPVATPDPVRPWKALAVLTLIGAVLALIAAIGMAVDFDPDSPFLYPVGGETPRTISTVPITVASPKHVNSLTASVIAYDPLGDGTESDDEVHHVVDGDPSTFWRTEAYSRPIGELKEGAGLVFDVAGTPTSMFVRGSAGATFRVSWAPALPDDPVRWEHIASGTLQASEVAIQLPVRGGGVWRLWLVDLPARPDGSYQAVINEVWFGS